MKLEITRVQTENEKRIRVFLDSINDLTTEDMEALDEALHEEEREIFYTRNLLSELIQHKHEKQNDEKNKNPVTESNGDQAPEISEELNMREHKWN